MNSINATEIAIGSSQQSVLVINSTGKKSFKYKEAYANHVTHKLSFFSDKTILLDNHSLYVSNQIPFSSNSPSKQIHKH